MFKNEKGKVLILDGAIGSELERRGVNIKSKIWTAKAIAECPDVMKEIHKDYFRAGATVAISSSYQATVQGYMNEGYSREQAVEYIKDAYRILKKAADEYVEETGADYPYLVAAVGPYGAYLSDGSEYRGNYGLSGEELYDFHKERMEIIKDSGATYFACETIPSFLEAKVLAGIVEELGMEGWMTFSALSGKSICDGTPIEECARYLDGCSAIDAIGINCTKPKHIESLTKLIRKNTDKAIVVYGNAGAEYDAVKKVWYREDDMEKYADFAEAWYEAGANVIGGCCQTGPEEIKDLYEWRKGLK